jgi:hypothetical protein
VRDGDDSARIGTDEARFNVALDLDLELDDDSNELAPHAAAFDGRAEEAFSVAVQAWHTMRAHFDAIDTAKLSPESRDAYARLLSRVGMWSDAKSFGEPIESEE